MQDKGFEIKEFNIYGIPVGIKNWTCPKCSHTRKPKNQKVKCMQVWWDRGIGNCHHCGDDNIQLHSYTSQKTNNSNKIHHKPMPAPIYEKIYTKPKVAGGALSEATLAWFASRGIRETTLNALKVTQSVRKMPPEWHEMETIHFNYYQDDELINIKYRGKQKRFALEKGAKLIPYNMDVCKLFNEVIIVEGEMDVLSYVQSGILNTTSTPNGSTLKSVNLDWLDDSIDFFDNMDRIYLALDADEAGQNVTAELIRRLGASRCYLVDFKGSVDANEYMQKHGEEALKDTIAKAREVPIENVSGVLDWEDEFDNYVVNGMQKGFGIGCESFDKIFTTYLGQYIVVTGKPSSGKSDWVDQMTLGYAMSHGWKTAIASPENMPYTIHSGKLMSKLSGTWVNKEEYLSTGWYRKGKEFVHDYYKYISLKRFGLEEVLERTRELIKRYGIKVLVIDPYNKVRLHSSLHKGINDYTNDYLNMIDEFAREHNILIFLVAHPVKPSGEERATYEPDFYSIKGGGEFYDMSPHGLLVHRDFENEMVKIKVLKVKFNHLGENHAHCWQSWNKGNGRYMDWKHQADEAMSTSGLIEDRRNWILDMFNDNEQESLDFNAIASESNFMNSNEMDEIPF